jgi:ATP-dependent helicase/nuclease subunit A
MSGPSVKRSDIVVTAAARGRQVDAGDPAQSAWVTANAGSGKTFVLSERVLRLLLDGVDPARILCLTYTRTGAANMREAVFERLSKLATADEASLAAAVAALTIADPAMADAVAAPPLAPQKALAARRLFARALETPGGLRIQTIHAFCESVLRRFPLEANIAGHFQLLQDSALETLGATVRGDLLGAIGAGRPGPAESFSHVMAVGGEAGLDRLFHFAIANRIALARFIAGAKGRAAGGGTAAEAFAPLFAAFGFKPGETQESVAAAVWPCPVLDEPRLRQWLDAGIRGKSKNMTDRATAALKAVALPDAPARADALAKALLTGNGTAFKALGSNETLRLEPDSQAVYERAAAHIIKAHARLGDFRLLAQTASALDLCDAFLSRMEEAKRASGLLDFADMIEATRRLLTRKGVAPWVRYKLDAGIDHILLDEAQDTSPAQWAVLDPLVEDLFTGMGETGRRRSLFVVGDPKQSIFSFQGARPEGFATQKHRYRALAGTATPGGVKLEDIEFQSSFRTAQGILDAVDAVFAKGRPARDGLAEGPDGTAHASLRNAAPGRVDVWEPLVGQKPEEPEEWHQRTQGSAAPEVQLAARIVRDITRRMAETGLRPGDVLILVRKRSGIVPALTRLLKERGIPVAGADRLNLLSAIAVRDLIAIARVAQQPADDLSLAALMKSPVFGLTDDDLLRIAPERAPGVTLLSVLARAPEPEFRHVAETVAGWEALAREASVPDFFARLLGEEGLRRRFLARLGPETDDLLDEFLRTAEEAARDGTRGLDAFVERLAAHPPTIKREMEQGNDQVRIMTIHAAKGLEAPHVYLIDGTSAAKSNSDRSAMSQVVPPLPPLRGGEAWLWLGGQTEALKGSTLLAEAKALELRRAEDEYRRLLYVAMTRAKDRLTVAVHATASAKPEGKWAAWVREALSGLPGVRQVDEDGFASTTFETHGTRAPEACPGPGDGTAETAPAPFAFTALPQEERLPRPLAPSVASLAIEPDDEPPPSVSPLVPSASAGASALPGAMARGTLIHRLLQRLPDLPPDARPAAGRRLAVLLAAGHGLDGAHEAGWLDDIVKEALAVLAAPQFADLFEGASRSEAGIMGRVSHHGTVRSVTGVIDRLIVTDEAVTLVDFKTGRTPRDQAAIPGAHVAQLALYALLARAVFRTKPVRAVLAYTSPPRRFDLSQAVLDEACAALGIAPPPRARRRVTPDCLE